MAQKPRLDELLVERGLVDTRAQAQGMIMAREVMVAGQVVDKAGARFAPHVEVALRGAPARFVSRGGLKLEAALDGFGYDCTERVVIDVGASTGGFTDCVLQRGAARVYAVDVGYGQLAWRLRQDPRVINLERQNIRHLADEAIPEPCALAVIDCSFIALSKVLAPTLRFLSEGADVLALIKPQFEVSKEGVGEGGVVRDPQVRAQAIERSLAHAHALGLVTRAGMDCPVHGPAGNVEYLAWLQRVSGVGA